MAGTYSLTSGSDDGTWAFIDGKLVVDNGGVHGVAITTSNFTLTTGLHSLEIFYEDRHTTGAVFDLTSFVDPNGNPVNLSPVPEPATLTLTAGRTISGRGRKTCSR